MFDFSLGTVYNILTKQLKMSKVLLKVTVGFTQRSSPRAEEEEPCAPLEYYLLHQNNASAQTAASTTLEIGLLGFGTVLQPPYSPDLSSFDFSIFSTVKQQLKGHRSRCLHDLKQATSKIIAQYGEDWHRDVFAVGTPAPEMYRA